MKHDCIGNIELMKRHKMGFLAPSHIAPLAVLPTLDWAVQMAQREDIAVMSGFSSSTELDVLKFLKQGKCGIILVLARCHYKKLPDEWQTLFDTSRLLIISTSNTTRQSKPTATIRNKYICEHSDKLYMPSKPIPTSNLHNLFLEYSPTVLITE